MAYNLIGLLRASKVGAAPGQGMREYAAGSITGTRMTDYRVISHTLTGEDVPTTVRLPPFVNVNFTTSYVGGIRVPDIYWEDYTDAITVDVDDVFADGVPQPQEVYGLPNATVRSYTVNPLIQTADVTINFANWIYYTGTLPSEGLGYFVEVPIRLGFRPEPHFNLPHYTEQTSYVVKPYVLGQPRPNYVVAASLLPIFDAGSDWTDLGGGDFLRGDEVFRLITSGDMVGNYRLVGYRVRGYFTGSDWWSEFSSNYMGWGLKVAYRFERLSGSTWELNNYYEVSTVVSPLAGAGWFYGTPGQSFTVRLKTSVLEPFSSPTGTSTEYAFTIADKVVGPGGGPIE